MALLLLFQGFVIVILWVSMWSIIEMIVDNIAKEDKQARFMIYVTLAIFGLILAYILIEALNLDPNTVNIKERIIRILRMNYLIKI